MKNDTKLDDWRNQIDALDEALISLLSKRMMIVQKIGVLKKQKSIPFFDPNRRKKLLSSLVSKAKARGLDLRLVTEIWNIIHKYALIIESV